MNEFEIKSINDLKECFIKVCVNAYPVYTDSGNVQYYHRDDLYKLAQEARKNGQKYFYVEPVNPNNKYGKLRLCEPKYEYRLIRNLSENEYKNLFGEK